MSVFELTVGDWSHDGHNQKDEFIICCDLSLEEVREAYDKAAETYLAPHEICEEYCDNKLTIDQLERMGLTLREYYEFDTDPEDQDIEEVLKDHPGELTLYPDEYAQLFCLWMTKHTGHKFTIENMPNIRKGSARYSFGYGCYLD